jgi:hypothetical protein
MRLFWIVFLVLLPLIAIINFVDASARGEPLPWVQIPVAVGMALWCTGILWISRRWFNWMAGEEICHWRQRR